MNADSYDASPEVRAIFGRHLQRFFTNSGDTLPRGEKGLVIFQRKMYEVQRDLIKLYHMDKKTGKWEPTPEAGRGKETANWLEWKIEEMKASEAKANPVEEKGNAEGGERLDGQ